MAYMKCPACFGRGTTSTDPSRRCAHCDGTGELKTSEADTSDVRDANAKIVDEAKAYLEQLKGVRPCSSFHMSAKVPKACGTCGRNIKAHRARRLVEANTALMIAMVEWKRGDE